MYSYHDAAKCGMRQFYARYLGKAAIFISGSILFDLAG
jgi:hypothetical protein